MGSSNQRNSLIDGTTKAAPRTIVRLASETCGDIGRFQPLLVRQVPHNIQAGYARGYRFVSHRSLKPQFKKDDYQAFPMGAPQRSVKALEKEKDL
jgi:hypothetical protein